MCECRTLVLADADEHERIAAGVKNEQVRQLMEFACEVLLDLADRLPAPAAAEKGE